MSKIENKKQEVNNTLFNEKDILNDLLLYEKNLSNNYSTTLNEMSNKILFRKVFTLFKESKTLGRDIFDYMFKNGWYTLETAREEDISKVLNDAKKEYGGL